MPPVTTTYYMKVLVFWKLQQLKQHMVPLSQSTSCISVFWSWHQSYFTDKGTEEPSSNSDDVSKKPHDFILNKRLNFTEKALTGSLCGLLYHSPSLQFLYFPYTLKKSNYCHKLIHQCTILLTSKRHKYSILQFFQEITQTHFFLF